MSPLVAFEKVKEIRKNEINLIENLSQDVLWMCNAKLNF